jgi:hypothetical protein
VAAARRRSLAGVRRRPAARAPEAERKRIRREMLRGHSVADAPELLGLASIELTHRVYRAAAIRPRRGLPPKTILQLAALPVVLIGLLVIGGGAARIAGVASRASRWSRRCSATTSGCACATSASCAASSRPAPRPRAT